MTNDSPEKEKREKTRIPASLNVDYSTYSPYHLRRITNISEGGVFIRTQEILPVGTELDMSFDLPNYGEKIFTRVKVMWTYRQPSTVNMNSSGMGVQFLEIEQKDRQAIQDFIDQSIES